jgi:hypothetical protein
MIRVKIERRADGAIVAFSVSGHAYYDKPGKDIVCAGVSAVTIGTVNAVEALTGVELPNEMRDGLLHVVVPSALDPARSEKVQLLLESMLVMLRSIEQSYGKYMSIEVQQHS